MRIKWSEEKINWIIDNKSKYKSLDELVYHFNMNFNLMANKGNIKDICSKHKIPLIFKETNRWDKEKLEWLSNSKKVYNDREDILKAFNERFNVNVSMYLLNKNNGRYKLGLPKSNRTLLNNAIKNLIKHRGFFERPDGYEVTYKNGSRTFIKSDTSKRKDGFVPKNRYLYEQYHNVKLHKINDVILHLDGNHDNFSKENLYLIKRKVLASIVKNELLTNDVWENLKRLKVIEWKMKIKEKENENNK